MPIKCGNIPGFLVMRKKDLLIFNHPAEVEVMDENNKAIDQQSQVKIGLNREKLAEALFKSVLKENHHQMQFQTTHERVKKYYYEMADYIIAQEGALLKVVK